MAPEKREKLIDIINDFFGCDAAYFDVNPFDLANHLIDNGVFISEPCTAKPSPEWAEYLKTNLARVKGMSGDDLAKFICLSPEMDFEVCHFCQYANPTPFDDRGGCLHDRGICLANARAEALKKWFKQPAKEVAP